jgi:flagella basal body P-ring formation protein FlgA
MRLAFSFLAFAWIGASIAEPSIAGDGHLYPVPAVTIYPGDTIKESWLTEREISAESLAVRGAVLDSRQAIIGKMARRTLLPGMPIFANSVTDPRAVTNGARVKIIFEEGGLSIVTYGSALQAGGVGDVVSVRNLDSGLTVSGTIQPDGSVRVSGS